MKAKGKPYVAHISARISVQTMNDNDSTLKLVGHKASAVGLQGVVIGESEVVVLASWIGDAPVYDFRAGNIWKAVVDCITGILLRGHDVDQEQYLEEASTE